MKSFLVAVLCGFSLVSSVSAQTWTRATVQPESKINGDRYYIVLILDDGSNGKRVRRELEVPVLEATAPLIAEKLRMENQIDVAKSSVVTPGTVISLANRPTPPPPSKEEADKAAWLAKRNRYLRKRADVAAGLTVLQPEVDALLEDLNKTYQPGYVD